MPREQVSLIWDTKLASYLTKPPQALYGTGEMQAEKETQRALR